MNTELMAEHIATLERRRIYIETERIGKMSPDRPGLKHDIREVQALKVAVQAMRGCIGTVATDQPSSEFDTYGGVEEEEPPRIAEIMQSRSPLLARGQGMVWTPGGGCV